MTRHPTFTDATGAEHDYESAVGLMDDDLREQMHLEGIWDTPQAFITEYARRHRERFGEDFDPFVGGDW